MFEAKNWTKRRLVIYIVQKNQAIQTDKWGNQSTSVGKF